MKKTQILELFSNIKATFMSFFAIMLFVVLSVGVFSGISWTSPALQKAADKEYDKGSLYDIEVQFPNGLTEEDMEELKKVEGVDEIDTCFTALQMLKLNGKEYVTKITSLMDNINVPINVDGNLPKAAGEIALNRAWAEKYGVKIGDTVNFKHDAGKSDKDGMTYLACDTYEVTAIVDSPAYVSYNLSSYGFANLGSGYIQCLAFTAPESFDGSAYPGYVQAYIRSNQLRGLGTSSAKYEETADKISKEVTELGDALAEKRYGDLLNQANKAIEDAEKKLEDAKAKIEKAEKQIADGKKALADGKAEYSAQKKKLDEGYARLIAAQQEYDDAKRKYDKCLAMYNSMEAYNQKLADDTLTYDDIMSMSDEVDAFLADEDTKDFNSQEVSDLHNALNTFRQNVTEDLWNNNATLRELHRQEILSITNGLLAEADESLRTTGATLSEKEQQLTSGWNLYYSSAAKLNKGKKQIEDGEKLLTKKINELEKSKTKYEKGLKTLEKYKKQKDKIKDYDWTVLTREYNGGYMMVRQYSDLTDNLRFSMAALFIIIGLLVSYSSISRIVHDQIISIGTKKALGLRKKEIIFSYLAYSGFAVLIGGMLGLAAGTFGIEHILAKTIGRQFIMGTYSPYFSLWQGALLIIAEMILILLTTWFACRNVLKQQAVELLKGEKPPSAKPRFFENWKIWRRLPLLTKTVINNCINDKRRVFGTVIGIAGCTALIVTALTVDNNIQKSFKWQYDDVYSYDTVVRYNNQTKGAKENIEEALDGMNIESSSVYTSPYKLLTLDGNQVSSTVTVPFEDNYDSFVHFNSKTDDNNLDGEGVWVSVSYNAHFDAEVGDQIEIMDSEGQIHTFTIDGFFNHYLFNNQIVMSQSVYNKGFGTESAPNAFLVDSGEKDVQEIKNALSGIKGVRMVKDDYQSSFDVFDEFSNIAGAVVVVYLVLSVLMAIIVLFDLYSVFIEEKKKELIILMINGFSVRDARQYISRDTIVLTVFGIILGIAFGVIMGNITIITLEPDIAYFAKGIDWAACGIGAVVSALLATILCSIALKRVSNFKLSDINKL
ncbi:MAG: hypothetical protein PUE18_08995 [Firmicutes bacterium]|nr:hypothetical protein [Bacillota bacterium]